LPPRAGRTIECPAGGEAGPAPAGHPSLRIELGMAKRSLTGIMPTGIPHIANYIGAIRPALALGTVRLGPGHATNAGRWTSGPGCPPAVTTVSQAPSYARAESRS
jgi:hypothetical protein